MPQVGAGLVKNVTERHRGQFEMGKQAIELLGGERCEKMVLSWAVRRRHRQPESLDWGRAALTMANRYPCRGSIANPDVLMCPTAPKRAWRNVHTQSIEYICAL